MAFLWHCCENLPLESLFWRVFACLTLHFHWLRVTLDNHSQTVWLHVLGKECVRVRFTTIPPSLTWCISYPAPFLSFFLSLSFGTDRNRSLSRWGFEEGLTHSGKGERFGKKATSVQPERAALFLSVERLFLGQRPSALSSSHWNDSKPTRQASNHPTDNSCWVHAENQGLGSLTNGGQLPHWRMDWMAYICGVLLNVGVDKATQYTTIYMQ